MTTPGIWSLSVILKRDLYQDSLAYSLNFGPSPKPIMHCSSSLLNCETQIRIPCCYICKKKKPRKQPHSHQYSGALLYFSFVCVFFLKFLLLQKKNLVGIRFILFLSFNTLRFTWQRFFQWRGNVFFEIAFIPLMMKIQRGLFDSQTGYQNWNKSRPLTTKLYSNSWTTFIYGKNNNFRPNSNIKA